MSWKKIRKYLPIIGIGLFIYLLIRLDITKIFQEIKNLNFSYLFIAIGLLGIFFVIQTLKWFMIAREQRINIPFKDALKINIISDFYGIVTPSKIGSIMRIDYLRKYKADTGKGLSNFVIDKILDLSSLFILTIVFSFIFYRELISSIISFQYQIVIIAIFMVMVVLSLLFYKKETSRSIVKVVYKIFIPKRLKEKSRIMFDSFYEDMPSLIFLFLIFLVGMINWIVNYAMIYFISLSLGVNIGFIPFLIIMPISTLVAQIPITINGLGTREITMISLFELFGVNAVKVFSMSLIGIIISSIIPTIIAIIFICQKEK